MHSKNSKLARFVSVAAALLSVHCAANAIGGPDSPSRAAAVARMQPLVKTVAAYGDTLSVVGDGQSPAVATQAAATATSALAKGSRLPVQKVARAVHSARTAAKLPDTTVQTFLNNRVFTAENVESVSGDTTTYLLHGDGFCNDANTDPEDATSDCAQNVDSLAIRLVADTGGAKQAITIEVGAGKASVATLTYDTGTQAITMDGDLAQMQAVLTTLGRTSQLQATGHVSLSLAQGNSNSATMVLGFPSDVKITEQNSNDTVSIAAAPQAFTLSANATQWSMALNLQAVDINSGAYTSGNNITGTTMVHIAGLTGAISGDASSQGSVTISGFGFGDGPSSVTQAGHTLIQAEINADANHLVDVTVGAQDQNGAQLLTFSPKLTADVTVALAPLTPGYNVPQELMNNHYGLSLTNGNNPAAIMLAGADLAGLSNGSLQVAQGQLVLTSDQGNVTVPAGQCLEAKPGASAGPSWVLEQQAAVCDVGP